MIVAEELPPITEQVHDVLDSVRRGCLTYAALRADTGRGDCMVRRAIVKLRCCGYILGGPETHDLGITERGKAILAYPPADTYKRRHPQHLRVAIVSALRAAGAPIKAGKIAELCYIRYSTVVRHLTELKEIGVVGEQDKYWWLKAA